MFNKIKEFFSDFKKKSEASPHTWPFPTARAAEAPVFTPDPVPAPPPQPVAETTPPSPAVVAEPVKPKQNNTKTVPKITGTKSTGTRKPSGRPSRKK